MSDKFSFKVVGVSFNNDDDGTSRQEILRRIKSHIAPFDGKVTYTLRKYYFDNTPAVGVYANGIQVGNVPKEYSSFIFENINHIQYVSAAVYGGGVKEDGEKKNYGMEITIALDKRQIVSTTYDETKSSSVTDHLRGYYSKNPKKVITLLLCVFGGYFGLHQFYVGNTKKGILYLCTMGVFGIMWIVDIFTILTDRFKY